MNVGLLGLMTLTVMFGICSSSGFSQSLRRGLLQSQRAELALSLSICRYISAAFDVAKWAAGLLCRVQLEWETSCWHWIERG
ncbi:hypothetical protein FGO68_gene3177 [Halteria grandinella]|uniref:Secreted protein n=1 Tax=Halteria grandinella TaxID=5974 RepID=A0A8J8NF90_HALGN|nr:hypothetical protein FGO68_gene3177 [Halteria grandinella]